MKGYDSPIRRRTPIEGSSSLAASVETVNNKGRSLVRAIAEALVTFSEGQRPEPPRRERPEGSSQLGVYTSTLSRIFAVPAPSVFLDPTMRWWEVV